MNSLVTGSGGFIGSHLVEYLLGRGFPVWGMTRRTGAHAAPARSHQNFQSVLCAITDRERLERIVADIQPERVFHLAAQSYPVKSWQEAEETMKVNLFGALYLLEAIRKAQLDPVILMMGSSAEYAPPGEDGAGIGEDHEINPLSPYGVSKAAADLLARLYFRSCQMKIVRVRPFAIIGPGKEGDACSDFARQISAIDSAMGGELSVGNLHAVRDFLDVRDAVRALDLLGEKGGPGEVYNVASGQGVSLQEVLRRLISLSGKKISVRVDPERLRPVDQQAIVGDNGKLLRLGWEPAIPLDETLRDILQFWDGRAKAASACQPSRHGGAFAT